LDLEASVSRDLAWASVTPKKHIHQWVPIDQTPQAASYAQPDVQVCHCGLARHDYELRSRRGRNNRSRGGRAELDVARTYGGEKVGPLGLPEDIRGKHWATQVKVSQRMAPPMWRAEFAKLSGQGRTPRLILRFARQGVKAEDYIVVRGSDWLEWFGKDE